ncbi:hypothetical protein WMY93_027278 [Mugilogobius chulae]|uniref:Pyruvate dehydrogenase E1 component subunit alpha, testis-specific form, mitochondrial n=1 Tax=Mugilogobius chulae TaxID=88201 RepID=A0AAW0N3E0_9GOBI
MLTVLSEAICKSRALSLAVPLVSKPFKDFNEEATFDTKKCELHGLVDGPPDSAVLTRDQGLRLFRWMQTIRFMQQKVQQLYTQKLVRGPCHLYLGQEACAVGIEAAIDQTDHLITSYRVHGFTFTRGVSVREILTEITGRRGGVSKGRGGPMHMYAPYFYGGIGIVGAQVSLGAGIALACQYQSSDQISVAVYGDGAANQGQLFEVFNMAALWKLPCVFVCENNGYAKGRLWSERRPADGMDVLSVREATKFAKNYCRSGKGPIILELKTQRYCGHLASDVDTSNRSPAEIEEQYRSDPISRLREQMLCTNMASAEEFQQIDFEILEEMEAAAEFAVSNPEPSLDDLCNCVYHNSPSLQVRGLHPWAKLMSADKER